MKSQKEINTVFTLLLSGFFQNYKIVGNTDNSILFNVLYNNFKQINTLLEKDYIFYS